MTQPLMALTARFDVNQVDDGIDWLFTDLESAPGADRKLGDPHWNRDIGFSAGQKFRIAVTASDQERTGFTSFEIIDCCLITRPRILRCGKDVRTYYAPPSLFVGEGGQELGALYRIEPSAFTVLATAPESPEKGRRITLLWNGELNVGPYNGFWELSFYLTVRIQRAGSDGTQLRVFYFDPETEVGNGMNPPD